jgi:glycosyltransferase involved in cell wall biosynthesis
MLNGVAVSVATFAHELERQGVRVYIFAPAYRGYQETADNVFRFPSFHPPHVPDYPLSFPYSSKALARFGGLHIDVVHTHSPFLLGRVGAALARRHRLPLVHTYHTLITEYVHYVPFARGLARRAAIRLSRTYCNRATAVIVPTPAIRDVLHSYGVTAPIAVIPTGVDLQPDPPGRQTLRQQWGVSEATPVLLFVGRIAREKNVALLLQTHARIVQTFPEACLVLVGGGPELAASQARARALGIADRTRFVGPVAHDQIAAYYTAADLFLFPSVTETQGVVLTEAMSVGLPCVAARAYGAAQIVRDGSTGFLTEPTAEALASAALTLLQRPALRQQMSRQSRAAAQSFSSPELAQQLVATYENALRSRRPNEISDDFSFPP